METNTNQDSPRMSDRPLRRSTSGKVLAGVASGIALRLDIPAWVVRLAFIVLSFGGGLGIALYVAGWLLIPADDETETVAHGLFGRIQGGSDWMGVVLVGIGVLIAASSIDFIRGDLAIAVFLAVVGVMLYRGEMGDRRSAPRDPEERPGDAAPVATASRTRHDVSEPPVPAAPPDPPVVVADVPPPPSRPQRPPSILGRLTVAIVLIATGVMAFFDYAVAAFDPTPRHYLGLAMGMIGAALVVGSVIGRARGLIFAGIVLAPLLVLSPLAEFDLGSGVGQRRVAASSVEDIASSYAIAMGELVVDLRGVDFAGRTVELDTSVGIGSLRVLVPDEVGVELDAEVGVGEVQSFGAVRSGFARDIEMTRDGVGTLVLDARTLVGEVQVTGGNASSNSVESIDLTVLTPRQLEPVYSLQTGVITLDLSNLVLRSPRTVTISNGEGQVWVIVPNRETTVVNAHAAMGDITLFGTRQSGRDTSATSEPVGTPLLTLNIEIDSGEIVVEEG